MWAKALVAAGTPALTIVGKSWDFQAREVLGVSLDENLRMIADSVAFLAGNVAEVVYDAEHFFDGFKANPEYALQTLRAAESAGAAVVIPDAELTPARLAQEVGRLLGDASRLAAMARASAGLARPNAARDVAAELLAAAGRG